MTAGRVPKSDLATQDACASLVRTDSVFTANQGRQESGFDLNLA